MNIVLVEDNKDLRSSLADFLAISGHEVSEAGSATELYRLMDHTSYDVAVVDINLPRQDGFAITRYLSENELCSVIITSVRDAVDDRVHGYQCGADIYMVKPVPAEELAAAIARLGRYRRSAEAQERAAATWSYDRTGRRLWAPNGKPVSLSAREAGLIEAVSRSSTGFVSRQDLLDALGDEQAGNSKGKIDTLVSRLRTKVREKTDTALPLVTAHNVGFSFSTPIIMR